MFFACLSAIWGPFTIDCFASFYNTKLPHFYSRFWNPGSLGVDALSYDWAGENVLVVPPVVSIPATLKHIKLCKCKGVLVFPYWPSHFFWPLLWSVYQSGLRGYVTEDGSHALQHGRNTNALLGSPSFGGLVLAAFFDFS